jgi:hypothetical protein
MCNYENVFLEKAQHCYSHLSYYYVSHSIKHNIILRIAVLMYYVYTAELLLLLLLLLLLINYGMDTRGEKKKRTSK